MNRDRFQDGPLGGVVLFVSLAIAMLLGLSDVRGQLEPRPEDAGAAGLGLALRPLTSTLSVLFVTAHPDDEHNALLSYLSRGRGFRVGVLTLTRGQGGQNEIGPEIGEALAVLRTEELLAVHRLDGVEQLFGRVVDFGYSFSVEETLAAWDATRTLADIVRVFRTFRPDVVVTMRPHGPGGGQHHQTSARLAEEAFHAAGRRDRFPEQLGQGLRPWAPAQLYRAPFRLRNGEDALALSIPVGDFDPLLGMSYAEHGAVARNFHRCQGMNQPPVAGVGPSRVLPVVPAAPVEVFAGLDTTLARWEVLAASEPERTRQEVGALRALAEGLAQAAHRGNLNTVQADVLRGLARLRTLQRRLASPRSSGAEHLRFLLARAESRWAHAAAVAHQFVVEPLLVPSGEGTVEASVDGRVVPGETFRLQTRVVQRDGRGALLRGLQVRVPPGWQVRTLEDCGGGFQLNVPRIFLHEITVPPDAAVTQPFWRRDSMTSGRYAAGVPDELASLPFSPPDVAVDMVFESHGVVSTVSQPARYRWYDSGVGLHRSHTVRVVPPLSVHVEPESLILSTSQDLAARELTVRVRHEAPWRTQARVRLLAPAGWQCRPASVELDFEPFDGERTLRFEVEPPDRLAPGEYPVSAVCEADGKEYRRGYQAIAYHHVETRHLYHPARAVFRAFPLVLPERLQVGYVMGVGDLVPEALEQLGVRVTRLEAEDLAQGDLSGFDAVVTGVRAYKDRDDLISSNDRLLRYVQGGGVMIVQYNKYEFLRKQYGPYPATIHRPHDRVTDENASVRTLNPAHGVFRGPNAIGAQDWDGWVQERGLYFWRSWDARYEPLLELEDSFPYNAGVKRGALLAARHGKGWYVYTGLAFFRQLPAGVPGAYRLFVNLVSLGRG